MKKETSCETQGVPNFTIYSADDYICTDDEILKLALYDESASTYEPGYAYIDGAIFYIFRGPWKASATEPGIYQTGDQYFRILVETEEERMRYDVTSHLTTLKVEEIVDIIKQDDDLYIAVPESSRMFIPPIRPGDDILKRAIKLALLEKNIDIDQYKSRFSDKNALFNFKQVLKGETTKLSMLLFERGTDALNLKYTIIIEEKEPNNSIGRTLSNPIVVSSEDLYDL